MNARPAGLERRKSLILSDVLDNRLFNWVWHIRGGVSLPPGRTGEDVFDRLEPLFHQRGTHHDRAGNALNFEKRNPNAQDRMAVFDSGELRIEGDQTAPMLRYDLKSRTLLACFLAPFLFLAFGQLTNAIGELEKSQAITSKKDVKNEAKPVGQLHPIDQALGAPAPPAPEKDKDGARDENPRSPTSSYVFAALFALLYAIGRVLEARQVRRQFTQRLAET